MLLFRPHLMRSLLAVIAVCALTTSATSQAQIALDDIMKSKEMKIAIPTDFPP